VAPSTAAEALSEPDTVSATLVHIANAQEG